MDGAATVCPERAAPFVPPAAKSASGRPTARSPGITLAATRNGVCMRYRPFAKTGLYVSEICLGTMTFGGKGFWQAIGALASNEVETLVGTSLDAGVNFIDTADVYSEGESERLLGEALAALKRPRERII